MVQENFKTSITIQLYSRILPICLLPDNGTITTVIFSCFNFLGSFTFTQSSCVLVTWILFLEVRRTGAFLNDTKKECYPHQGKFRASWSLPLDGIKDGIWCRFVTNRGEMFSG